MSFLRSRFTFFLWNCQEYRGARVVGLHTFSRCASVPRSLSTPMVGGILSDRNL